MYEESKLHTSSTISEMDREKVHHFRKRFAYIKGSAKKRNYLRSVGNYIKGKNRRFESRVAQAGKTPERENLLSRTEKKIKRYHQKPRKRIETNNKYMSTSDEYF